ncbi:MAG: hypothetical protein EPO39_09745 [Candidatus Manganitrophaceae bacterium]|nr:MAG: hypothetical protein EPO39_09745 [Candidatus Manganitrophaceae bacterium]
MADLDDEALPIFSICFWSLSFGSLEMKVIRKSSLNEYAKQFWKRQRQDTKRTDKDEPALADIDKGGDPISWLANIYPYKLPQPFNDKIELVKFETLEELDSLLIHDYMISGEWMQDRDLVPTSKTRRLGDLAALALERRYFETERPDTQITLFKTWKEKANLNSFIDNNSLPLVEGTGECCYEIVDGWGRLHAMTALVKRGMTFEPFNCFIASSAGISGTP